MSPARQDAKGWYTDEEDESGVRYTTRELALLAAILKEESFGMRFDVYADCVYRSGVRLTDIQVRSLCAEYLPAGDDDEGGAS